MKIRSGFVSNSSSSSFIVSFPHKPKTSIELFQMMFPNQPLDGTIQRYDDPISMSSAVERVFSDIDKCEEVDKFALVQELRTKVDLASSRYNYDFRTQGSYPDLMELDRQLDKSRDKFHILEEAVCKKYKIKNSEDKKACKEAKDELTKLREDGMEEYRSISSKMEELRLHYAEKLADEYLLDYKNRFNVLLTYGDENGTFESVMEHGDVFSSLPHVVISHH